MKRMWKKRGLALLLVLTMMGSMAACGRDGGNSGGQGESEGGGADLGGDLPATVFVPERQGLPAMEGSVVSAALDGETLYLVDSVSEEVQADSNGIPFTYNRIRSRLLRAALGGTEGEELPEYEPLPIPEGAVGGNSIDDLTVMDDGTLWLCERATWSYYNLPEDFNNQTDDAWDYQSERESASVWRRLDGDGRELEQLNALEVLEELGADTSDPYFTYGADFDEGGNIYLATSSQIFVLDGEKHLLFQLEGEQIDTRIVTLESGKKAAKCNVDAGPGGGSGDRLRTIDVEKQNWGESYDTVGSYEIYDGGGGFAFCYTSGDGLYGWEESTGAGRKLFSWFDWNLNQNWVQMLTFLDDGRMALLTWEDTSDTYNPTAVLDILTETDRSEVELSEKTVLTLGTVYLWTETENMIKRFNRTSEKYAIQVRDYTELCGGDMNQAVTKLTTEIQAGTIPDILDLSDLGYDKRQNLEEKNYLEDLWPYIDQDPDISRDTLMTRVMDAASRDGKLYTAFAHFVINTVVGSPEVVGDRMGWTLDDMVEAWQTMPEKCSLFSPEASKSDLLWTLVPMQLDDFVDWETGECGFESEAFQNLLAFCDTYGLEEDEEYDYGDEFTDGRVRLWAGQQMLSTGTVMAWTDIQNSKALFGGSVSYVGYPTVDGSCGSAFGLPHLEPVLAISTACADKEGAWSFVRQLFLPQLVGKIKGEDYSYSDFPTNKADFDWLAEQEMTPQYATNKDGSLKLDENGNPIEISTRSSGFGNDGRGNPIVNVDHYAVSQEEYDQIMALYNSVDRMYTYDTNLYQMVWDLAGSYFAGDRSLEDTCRLIQSRANLYVNENR